MCDVCKNSCIITRPLKTIIKTYVRENEYESVEIVMKSVIGGIDACPECARRAYEVDQWQSK